MDGKTLGIILGSVGGVLLLAVLITLLYFFVIRKARIKKQIKEMERKYSYLNALLVGQDSQFIHRLEMISHTNLLYVEKHEEFSNIFKEIYDTDNTYVQNILKQLNQLISNNQYRNIKNTINDANSALNTLENKVNELDKDLYDLIKLEVQARSKVLKLKESFRGVKQTYFANSNDLDLVSSSVNKVFDKLDSLFSQFEEYIESAKYDEANNLMPYVSRVINSMEKVLVDLPNICAIITHVIPEKLTNFENFYHEVAMLNVPVYHLEIDEKLARWSGELRELRKKVSDLSINGVTDKCNEIIADIEKFDGLLEQETADKKVFESESGDLYNKVKVLEDKFLRSISLLPQISGVYVLDEARRQSFENIKGNISELWNTKRVLDGFVNSETKQPYSMLKKKLEELEEAYEIGNTALSDFKAYLESLKFSCEEAYKLIVIYFQRTKQIELNIRQMNIPQISEQYSPKVELIYDILNKLDTLLKNRPIDVNKVNETVEDLKNTANDFFDIVEEQTRNCALAESAIVYANRDRHHQTDVNQQLGVLETNFMNMEFEKVYNDATAIYQNSHIEDNASGTK